MKRLWIVLCTVALLCLAAFGLSSCKKEYEYRFVEARTALDNVFFEITEIALDADEPYLMLRVENRTGQAIQYDSCVYIMHSKDGSVKRSYGSCMIVDKESGLALDTSFAVGMSVYKLDMYHVDLDEVGTYYLRFDVKDPEENYTGEVCLVIKKTEVE